MECVWWGKWVGLRYGSGSGWGGRVCLGWDSVRRAVDMVEGRVELVGVELAQKCSWVGWRQGTCRYDGYGGWEFGLGGENGVWQAWSLIGGEDMVLYGDMVGISGVALCGYILSSPYTILTPDTPHPPNPLLLPITIPYPNPTYLPNSS